MRGAVVVRLAAATSLLAWGLVAAVTASSASASEEKNPAASRSGEDRGASAPGSSDQSGSGNLSQQLDKSHGVIAPPHGVDPQMQVKPPAGASTGKMRVIPPPGSPGGNPDVVPK